MSEDTGTSRRVVIGGAAAIGAGAVLAACGGAGTEEPQGTANPTPEPPEQGAGGTSIGKASEVPMGSGTVSEKGKVIVTQPHAGEFKAYDWTCTHKGCSIKKVEGDTMTCPCHGSQFSTADGSVKHGPATRPLTEVKVVERGGELFLS